MPPFVIGRFHASRLPAADLPLGWFAISYRWVPEVPRRRRLYGKWCVLRDKETGARVFRLLRFASNLKVDVPAGTGDIALDWGARLELDNFQGGEEREFHLEISCVAGLRHFLCAWHHPDRGQRLSFQISVVLGALSVFVTLLSFVR